MSSGNTGKMICEQTQKGKYYHGCAEVEMGKTWTVAPSVHTEHQGMDDIPS